ncbi:MAG TPA: sodium:solute symporter family protein [Patescibacteria group bacterium]|nr:sodium:solute symporter family protein [Patescibacteria group bacterium]
MNVYLVAIIGYSALLIAAGLFFSRRVKSAPDFLVAGRSFGPGLIFATFLAANIGAGSTVGASGLGYRFGLAAWWWVGSAGIGSFVLAFFVGPKIWTIAKRANLSTLGDLLEYRYSKAVKAVIAVLIWMGTLAILAGQLIAISWILEVVAGIPKWEGCLLGGLVATIYCAAGGLFASALVNRIELTVTMSGLLISLPFALHSVGGWSGLVAGVTASVGPAHGAAMFRMTGAGIKQILAYVSILVPSFIVSPGLVQKLYGARNERSVRMGVGLNSLGQLAFAFVPAIFGLCALSRFPHLTNPELALPTVMMKMLPKWLGIWALPSIFSAELSATDAIMFMLSTSLAVDLYKTFLNPQVDKKKLLWVSRATTVLAGFLGVLLAIVLPSIITAITIFYTLLAVSLFVPVVLGLYWRKLTTKTALWCIFGAVGATAFATYETGGKGWWVISPALIGIVAALVIALLRARFAGNAKTGPLPGAAAGGL